MIKFSGPDRVDLSRGARKVLADAAEALLGLKITDEEWAAQEAKEREAKDSMPLDNSKRLPR